jgi:hypothetical protein
MKPSTSLFLIPILTLCAGAAVVGGCGTDDRQAPVLKATALGSETPPGAGLLFVTSYLPIEPKLWIQLDGRYVVWDQEYGYWEPTASYLSGTAVPAATYAVSFVDAASAVRHEIAAVPVRPAPGFGAFSEGTRVYLTKNAGGIESIVWDPVELDDGDPATVGVRLVNDNDVAAEVARCSDVSVAETCVPLTTLAARSRHDLVVVPAVPVDANEPDNEGLRIQLADAPSSGLPSDAGMVLYLGGRGSCQTRLEFIHRYPLDPNGTAGLVQSSCGS